MLIRKRTTWALLLVTALALIGGLLWRMTMVPPVFQRARQNDVAFVQKYLDSGGDPNATSTQLLRLGVIPLPLLTWASQGRASDVVALLLQRGATFPSPKEITTDYHPAAYALDNNDVPTMTLLLQHDLTADANLLGDTIIRRCIRGGKWDMALILVPYLSPDVDWLALMKLAEWEFQLSAWLTDGPSDIRTRALRAMLDRGMPHDVQITDEISLRDIALRDGDQSLLQLLSQDDAR